jgi:hypothetical protein
MDSVKWVSLVVLVCIVLIKMLTGPSNQKRHLTSEHSYAHFSSINASNYLLTPSLLFTSPYRFTLQSGQSLWIPKKWWHWIRTTSPSVAVNFWIPHRPGAPPLPYLIPNARQPPSLLPAIEAAMTDVTVWKSNTDSTRVQQRLDGTDNEYVITLDGYQTAAGGGPMNPHLLATAKRHAIIPPGGEMNVWVSGGNHDTGLHYDDNDGILTLLRGTKEITLYPPSDSIYLHPLEVLPAWATQPAARVQYNLYHFEKPLPASALPSARILYESIQNKEVLRQISRMKAEAKVPLVWGCKLEKGTLRWEIYVYHYNLYRNERSAPEVARLWNPSGHPCLIHSIDLADSKTPVGPDIHYYYKDSPGASLPIRGRGTTGPTKPEGVFRIDTPERMIRSFYTHATALGFPASRLRACKSLLYAYPCTHIAIWNKYKEQIYIQYLGISASDFLRFLRTHGYPASLIDHVEREGYEHLIHEITIVYDLATLKPVRTGFYGIV